MRKRILKESYSTIKTAEKYREKTTQRFQKHSRNLQERKTKDQLYSSKAAKENVAAFRLGTDKCITQYFDREVKTLQSSVANRLEAGKVVVSALVIKTESSGNGAPGLAGAEVMENSGISTLLQLVCDAFIRCLC